MAFCEQCGAKLSPGMRFCESCGARVEGGDSDSQKSSSVAVGSAIAGRISGRGSVGMFSGIFRGRDWKTKWEQVASEAVGEELGLMLTDGERLLADVCPRGNRTDRIDSEERFARYEEVLRGYCDSAAGRGVRYYLLDLSRSWFNDEGQYDAGEVSSILTILREVVNVARPKYLFILGGDNVIPVAEWNDETGDDETVESDLPYVTLNGDSPWSGLDYRFKNCLRVGRLPSCGCATADEEIEYFRYFDSQDARSPMHAIGKINRIVPYGLSALVWEDESNDEYASISSARVRVSPDLEVDDVRIPANANLLFFNLHGSDEDEHWFGQQGLAYPQAFAPHLLADRETPYFLAVEACYGARYTKGLTPDESVLLTAMRHGCIAFLGSSRIAYGTPAPKGFCADIIVGEFIKRVADGDAVGDAYIAGLEQLQSALADPSGGTEATVKTMAEFALYGDPSARTGRNKNVGGVKKLMKAFSSAPKGIHIPIPDVRRVSRMALAEVNRKIEALVDDFAMRELGMDSNTKAFAKVSSKTFRAENSRLNLKVYSAGEGIASRRLRVYFDDNGKVTKSLHSK